MLMQNPVVLGRFDELLGNRLFKSIHFVECEVLKQVIKTLLSPPHLNSVRQNYFVCPCAKLATLPLVTDSSVPIFTLILHPVSNKPSTIPLQKQCMCLDAGAKLSYM